MSVAVRLVITPRLGLYHSAPLPSPDPRGALKRQYLALLPEARFVRTVAPADRFDFAEYVRSVMTGVERRAERVSVVAGQPFHHLGEYALVDGTVQFTAWVRTGGEPFVPRWALELATSEFLVGRGEVYRWYCDL